MLTSAEQLQIPVGLMPAAPPGTRRRASPAAWRQGRPRLLAAWKAFAATPEAKKLTGEEKRALQHTMRDFKRSGLALPKEQRDKVSAAARAMPHA